MSLRSPSRSQLQPTCRPVCVVVRASRRPADRTDLTPRSSHVPVRGSDSAAGWPEGMVALEPAVGRGRGRLWRHDRMHAPSWLRADDADQHQPSVDRQW